MDHEQGKPPVKAKTPRKSGAKAPSREEVKTAKKVADLQPKRTEPPKPLAVAGLTKEAGERGIPADLLEHLIVKSPDDAAVRKGFEAFLAGEYTSPDGSFVCKREGVDDDAGDGEPIV